MNDVLFAGSMPLWTGRRKDYLAYTEFERRPHDYHRLLMDMNFLWKIHRRYWKGLYLNV